LYTWIKRVYFYFKPVDNTGSAFFFQAQYLLYLRQKSDRPYGNIDIQIGNSLCARGLNAWRNRSGKWNDREPVSSLQSVTTPLIYCYIKESETIARQRGIFNWQNEKKAIRGGGVHLRQFIGWVDEALKF
jgi:hypothetical protein